MFWSLEASSGGSLWAQEPAEHKLNITIVEGDGEINNIKSRVAREPIVEVTDENHKPVAGAILTFTTPNSGPTGTFANGSHLFTTTTDQSGRAVAKGFHPNKQSGKYSIRITATLGGLTATAVILQSNAAGSGAGGGGAAGRGGLFGLGVPATVAIVGAVAVGVGIGLWKGLGGGTQTTRVSVGPPSLP